MDYTQIKKGFFIYCFFNLIGIAVVVGIVGIVVVVVGEHRVIEMDLGWLWLKEQSIPIAIRKSYASDMVCPLVRKFMYFSMSGVFCEKVTLSVL